MSTRREIVIALAACTAAPRLVFAQQRVWRVGVLITIDEATYAPWIAAFKQGMQARGYAEVRDYVLEIRTARGDLQRMPALAAELVAARVDIFVTSGSPNTRAARQAAPHTPIVMVTNSDPVGLGFISSLAHPGGTITGLTNLTSDLSLKRLELLRELLPSLRQVGFILDPKSPVDSAEAKLLTDAAAKIGVRITSKPVAATDDVGAAFVALKREKIGGIIVTSGGNITRRATIVEQAARHRLPAIYASALFVTTGGLMSYGTDIADQFRRASNFVDKIFKGAKPGDLPIEQPTKFELAVNLKTAKALGLKLPNSVLMQATKVIE